METAFWIVSCIILCFIAARQARKIKVFRNLADSQRKLIDVQKTTISNQQGTIRAYKEILSHHG